MVVREVRRGTGVMRVILGWRAAAAADGRGGGGARPELVEDEPEELLAVGAGAVGMPGGPTEVDAPNGVGVEPEPDIAPEGVEVPEGVGLPPREVEGAIKPAPDAAAATAAAGLGTPPRPLIDPIEEVAEIDGAIGMACGPPKPPRPPPIPLEEPDMGLAGIGWGCMPPPIPPMFMLFMTIPWGGGTLVLLPICGIPC